jgi:hypothetical protein
MVINTDTVLEGINLNIGGSMQLIDTPRGHCSDTNGGELIYDDGCFYYCDGEVRNTLAENFKGPGVNMKMKCKANASD